MKKRYKQFQQHLAHDIEDLDTSWDHIEDSLSHVGYIIMGFNGLEKDLDGMLCETLSDRTDTIGLIVIQNMQFMAKVNLFIRFCDDLHFTVGSTPMQYKTLLAKLKAAATYRNTVVHADWENTDEHGFTYSKIEIANGEMRQEYVELTPSVLTAMIRGFEETRNQLDEYWTERSELLSRS
jgi:hypothetical protein